MDFGSVLLMFVVLLVLARLGSRVFARFGIPGLIGEILVGVAVANLAIGDWSLMAMLDIEMTSFNDNYQIILLFAEFGVIFLLFSIGLETKVDELMSVGKAAMLVAVMGVLLPLTMGILFTELIGENLHVAVFMGVAMVATSVGVTARVIKDMGFLDTKESRIIIGAAIIDDILGMVILALAIGLVSGSGDFEVKHLLLLSLAAVAFVLITMFSAKYLVPRIHDRLKERSDAKAANDNGYKPNFNKLLLALVICLVFSWMADFIGLAAIIGAFLGGMLIAEYAAEWKLDFKVESIMTLFLSFFFLNVGMQIDLAQCANWTVVGLSIAVVAIAVFSKYVGCSLGARFGDKTLDKTSAGIIGIGMIPRGEVGIIVATYGLQHGVLSMEIYTVLIVMAVATTIIAPSLLSSRFMCKYPLECDPHPRL